MRTTKCLGCLEEKALDQFYENYSYCKDCKRAYHRNQYKKARSKKAAARRDKKMNKPAYDMSWLKKLIKENREFHQ